MFIEGNPVTVKTAMKILGQLENDNVRLPLVSSERKTAEKLEKLFRGKKEYCSKEILFVRAVEKQL